MTALTKTEQARLSEQKGRNARIEEIMDGALAAIASKHATELPMLGASSGSPELLWQIGKHLLSVESEGLLRRRGDVTFVAGWIAQLACELAAQEDS